MNSAREKKDTTQFSIRKFVVGGITLLVSSLGPEISMAQIDLGDCVNSPACGIFIEDNQTVSETEGPTRNHPFKIKLNLEQVSIGPDDYIQVSWNLKGGGQNPATSGVDFFEPRDGFFFLTEEDAGQNVERELSAYILDDQKIEKDETIEVVLSASSNGLVKTDSSIITIIDDDAPQSVPRISATVAPVVEGDGTAMVTLSLDRSTTNTVSVTVATQSDTAIAGKDFYGTSGRISFSPGERVKILDIVTIDDTETESSDESFKFRLTNAENGAILYGSNVLDIVIIDNDSNSDLYSDVPANHWAFSEISRFAEAGIAGRCGTGPNRFCPSNLLRNDVMALWLLKAANGAGYQPPAATGLRFRDVDANAFAADWMEDIDAQGVTHGCNDYNLFCPAATGTRAAFAYALVRARYGVDRDPPAASGLFDDVPATHWAAPYIEILKRNDVITGGCQADPRRFCPSAKVTRAWASWMIVRMFDL